MTIMSGAVAAGRCGAGAVAESLHLSHKLQAEREGRGPGAGLGMAWNFETSKSTPSGTPPSTRPQHSILPKQFYYLRTKYSKI